MKRRPALNARPRLAVVTSRLRALEGFAGIPIFSGETREAQGKHVAPAVEARAHGANLYSSRSPRDTTIAAVEGHTGYRFLTNVPPQIREALETKTQSGF